MSKQREGDRFFLLRRSLLCGFASAALFLLLLFIGALLSETRHGLFEHSRLTAMICLGVCAVAGGIAAAGALRQSRLPYALAGESVLLAVVLIAGMVSGFRGGWIFLLADIGILLFGAFAGAISRIGIGRKRRGKR